MIPIERADPDRFLPDVEADIEGNTTTDRAPDAAPDRPTVRFRQPPAPGAYVRATGSDIAAGDVLLHRGDPLTPAGLGVVNGVGLTDVAVRRRLRVLLVPTGHEIRDPGEALGPGAIHDSNSVALTAALQSIGCAVDVRPCRSDDAADLLALLAAAHESGPDLVITVGGVSAGAREVVRDALGPLGVAFEKVAMQPGGPQGLGLAMLEGGPLPVVSLPGNPVSALVSFEAFLRGALLVTQGAAVTEREIRRAPAAEDLESPEHVLQLRRGVLRDGALHTVGGPSSHLLHSLAASTVLIRIPIGVSSVTAGDTLEFWRIDG